MRLIVKNSLSISTGQALAALCKLGFLAATARALGPEEFGRFTFAVAYTQFFGLISELGLGTVVTRDVARDLTLSRRYLVNSLLLRLLLGVAVAAVAAVTVGFLGPPEETRRAVYILSIAVVIGAVGNGFPPIFRAHERMEYEGISLVFSGLVILSSGLLLLGQGYGVAGAATALVLGFGAFLAAMLFFCLKRLPQGEEPGRLDPALWRHLLTSSFPLAAGSIAYTVYDRTDLVLLSLFRGDLETGIYGAPAQLLRGLAFIPNAFFISLLPVMARFYSHGPAGELQRLSSRVQAVALAGLVPVAIIVSLTAGQITNLLFGSGYSSSSLVMIILVWSLVFKYSGYTFAFLLVASDLSGAYARASLYGAAFSVGLNLLLIPVWGFVAAALVAAATNAATTLMFFLFSRRAVLVPFFPIRGLGGWRGERGVQAG